MTKSKILLVDDDPAFTRILRDALEEIGRFEVRVENSPLNAIITAIAFRPDLVVLDVIMPHLDGGDIAALLKVLPVFHDLPIIFLTAVVSKEHVSAPHGRILGGHRFLPKPIDTRDLIECIDRELMRPAA
jgi:two-component system OmpR family response regulator